MDLGDIILILLFIYFMVIAVAAGIFRGLGYSFLQSLTLGFLFVTFGIWNPVGWMLLVVFGIIQYKRNQMALEARRYAAIETATMNPVLLPRGRA